MAVGGVIDDPASGAVSEEFLDSSIESRSLVQLIMVPQFGNLIDDLLTSRIARLPLHGRMETVHNTVVL